MAPQGESNSIGPIEPQITVVVYRRNSGEVISVHHFGATRDVELPEQGELERIALARARSDAHEELNELAALAVRPHEVRVKARLMVSVEDRRLIPVDTDELRG